MGLFPFRKAFIKLPAWTGWGLSKDMPAPAKKTFRDTFKSQQAQYPPVESEPVKPKTPASQTHVKENLVGRFMEELLALSGQVYRVSKIDLTDKIINLLKAHNIERVQMWESVPGMDNTELTAAGIQVQHGTDPAIKAGITGALAAVAETGTLVIPSGQGQPLTASLLPEVHIAVLKKSDILPNLEAALRLPDVTGAESVALVSGPSRTADIEMTLTIGVHGPGELHVFIVEGD